MSNFLIYGANGYTGALIARQAVRQGLRPIIAGRTASAIGALAQELALESRVFAIEDVAATTAGIADVAAVLNCAGPFVRTAAALSNACLRSRVHYLDITGEEAVFDSLAQRDAEARTASVMLMPGVGFDVVPTDCLAAHLKHRLPTATRLTLAFSVGTRMSRGTANTVIDSLSEGGLVRQNGVLTRVPAAWKTRAIDFGNGPTKCMTIPWGDVVTAFHSTGIPNIEVYMAAPWSTRVGARLSRHLGWLLRSAMVQGWLRRRIQAGPPGPTEDERRRTRSLVWGEVVDDAGRKAVSRLCGPEGYDFTVLTSLAVVERVLAGSAPPGFQTPSLAYGADFVVGLNGITRDDE